MNSITSGAPKELLPVGGRPVLSWALGEAAKLASRSVIVVSDLKPEIEAVFDGRCEFIRQPVPNGLAAAIALAAHDESALIVLPDTIFYPSSPLARMAAEVRSGFDIVIAVETVGEEEVGRYGIVEAGLDRRIQRILEKPQPWQTASRCAVAARFALSSRAMGFLRSAVAEAGGEQEVDLTPILSAAIGCGFSTLAVPLQDDERRLDCGSPDGYERACEVVSAGL